MSDEKSSDYDLDILSPVIPEALDDDRAEKEAAGLAFGLDLSKARDTNKLNALSRQDDIHTFIHKITKFALLLATGMITACSIVLVFHFVAPDNWLFLSTERIDNLKAFLFSGAVGAGVSQLAKSKILNDKTEE